MLRFKEDRKGIAESAIHKQYHVNRTQKHVQRPKPKADNIPRHIVLGKRKIFFNKASNNNISRKILHHGG
jgi:hypothetical protein